MKLTVWSLTIWTRYQDSIEVFATEAEAKARLFGHVAENWARSSNDMIPDDPELATRAYFDRRDDESAFLNPHEIEIDNELLASNAFA